MIVICNRRTIKNDLSTDEKNNDKVGLLSLKKNSLKTRQNFR